MSLAGLGMSEDTLQFGRIAVVHGWIDRDQLTEAMVQQAQQPDRHIAEILVELGSLSRQQADWILGRSQGAETGQAAPAPSGSAPSRSPAGPTGSAPAPGLPGSAAGTAVPAGLPGAPSPAAMPGQASAPPLAATPAPRAASPVAVPPQAAPQTAPASPAASPSGPAAPAEPSKPPAPPEVQTAEIPTARATPPPSDVPSAPSARSTEVATSSGSLTVAPPAPRPTPAELAAVVQVAVQQQASDIHLHAGTPLKLRIHGRVSDFADKVATAESNRAILEQLLEPDLLAELDEKGQVDFAHTVDGVARLRGNAYRQQRGTDIVLRVVPPRPPTLAELGLPENLEAMADYHQGMVLITGPTGCGKSSTLAALVDTINQKKPLHVLTVEDPIEYVHESKTALVNQRQVNRHTESFARALRAALREDPDVIVIGELRDLETISLALTAAETGHLVLATMHTTNSIATLNRLIGAFPPEEQSQIRTMVSESLRATISQRLVARADGDGRAPALEIMIANIAIANLIREQKTFQLPGILQSGTKKGMCLLDQSLVQLVQQGVVTKEEALKHCDNKKNFGG